MCKRLNNYAIIFHTKKATGQAAVQAHWCCMATVMEGERPVGLRWALALVNKEAGKSISGLWVTSVATNTT